MDENKTYLAVLGSLLKWGSRLFRKCRHVSPFEHLVILLRLAELNVRLHSPATKFLYFGKPWTQITHQYSRCRRLPRSFEAKLDSVESTHAGVFPMVLELIQTCGVLGHFRASRTRLAAMRLKVVVFCLHTKIFLKRSWYNLVMTTPTECQATRTPVRRLSMATGCYWQLALQ